MNYALLLLPLICAINGCTLTHTESAFSYNSAMAPHSVGALDRTQFHSITVADYRYDPVTRRRIDDPRVLVHKRDQYKQQVGGEYAVERPLGDYVAEAFTASLVKSSSKLSPHSPVAIRIEIRSLDDPITKRGVLSRDKMLLVMKADVVVIDRNKQIELWRNAFTGQADLAYSGIFFSMDDILRALPNTIDDVILQCISSAGFKAALASSSRSS